MNNIISVLAENHISYNEIITGDISCSCNAKQYIIKQEGDAFKLLESNLCLNNPKKKNRFHEIDKLFENIDLVISFIRGRNIYQFN